MLHCDYAKDRLIEIIIFIVNILDSKKERENPFAQVQTQNEIRNHCMISNN